MRLTQESTKPFQQPLLRLTFSIGLVFAILITLTSQQTNAQDAVTVTPTPAPSKTVIPTATSEASETPESTGGTNVTSQPLPQAFTQADLSVLTGNVQRPNGITWHNGKLYASCTGDWTVYELDDTNGQTQTYVNGVRNAHTLYAETVSENQLNLWVPDFQSNTLSRVTRSGTTTVASNLQGPWGIAYLDANSFLVTNLQGNSVSYITRDGAQETVITGLRAPTGIAVNGDVLYVANNGSTRRAIEWYPVGERNLASDAESGAHSLVSGLQNTTGLTMGTDGYLYFAYSLGTRGVVGRVNPTQCQEKGGCTGTDVEIVLLTELAAPLAGLTVSPDMRLYIHTMFSPDIYWLQLPTGSA